MLEAINLFFTKQRGWANKVNMLLLSHIALIKHTAILLSDEVERGKSRTNKIARLEVAVEDLQKELKDRLQWLQ